VDQTTTISRPKAGDVWGGLAAMLVVLPSSIAFGVATYAALGREYVSYGVLAGIIGAIVTGLLSSPLGGSPRLISSPCGPAAAVLSAFAAQMMASPGGGAAARVAALMTVIALACGALQFCYGAIGGGNLIKYIPYPVVAGYLSGVGALIFAGQIPNFLGLPPGTGLTAGLSAPEHWRWQAIAVGLTTIAGIDFGRAQADQGRAGDHFWIGGGIARLFWTRPGLSGNVAPNGQQPGAGAGRRRRGRLLAALGGGMEGPGSHHAFRLEAGSHSRLDAFRPAFD
jgi:SulP family sulfate permease